MDSRAGPTTLVARLTNPGPRCRPQVVAPPPDDCRRRRRRHGSLLARACSRARAFGRWRRMGIKGGVGCARTRARACEHASAHAEEGTRRFLHSFCACFCGRGEFKEGEGAKRIAGGANRVSVEGAAMAAVTALVAHLDVAGRLRGGAGARAAGRGT